VTATAVLTASRFRFGVVAVSVAAAIGGSLVLATHHLGERTTTLGVSATLPVSGHPGWVAADSDALWIAIADARAHVQNLPLLHLDLASDNTVGLPVFLGGEITYLTRLRNELLASVELEGGNGSGPSAVVALDWRTGQILGRRQFAGSIGPLVSTGHDLWVLRLSPAALLRLDAHTLAPTARPLALTRERATGLAAGKGYLWVTVPDAGELVRIDESTRSIARFRIGGSPKGIAVAGRTVWIADSSRGRLDRLDPHTVQPIGSPVQLGGSPSSVAPARGYVFVGDAARGTIRRIEVQSGAPVGLPIRVAPPSSTDRALPITPAGSSVWVSSFASSTLTRVSASAKSPSAAPLVPLADAKSTPNVLPLPAAGRVVARLRVPAEGGPLAVGEGAIWAMSDTTSTLLRIDPTRNAVVARIKIPEGEDAAAGDGAVWITHPQRDAVSRIDPRTNTVGATIHVPGRPSGVAVSPGAVWVADAAGPSVTRIDPSSDRIVATIPIGPGRLCCTDHMSLTAKGKAVWVALPAGKRIVRIDQQTNRVTAVVRLDFLPCGFVAIAGGAVWSAGADCSDLVARIDARAMRQTAALTEPHAVGIAPGYGSVWVAALQTGNVERIDPRTARVVARLHVGGFPVRLAVGFGSVWVNDDKGRLLRIQPR
jgi:virginiamycin B lyase